MEQLTCSGDFIEVQALVHVWSDDHIRRQLESSTRKRDIFVQISSKLMQLGIERDWKQCHTKYKNLKYLYRSLQRGKTDDFDPRRIMRFYDQLLFMVAKSDILILKRANLLKCLGKLNIVLY
uniref:Myb/SANT-like DNA-binding domain-containing protein n=1 Tax=Gouania willdenowi TaxID=441366 RepID=A0A8C5EN41_GOUWI